MVERVRLIAPRVRLLATTGLILAYAAMTGDAHAQSQGGGFPSLPPAAIDVRTGDLRKQLKAYEPNQPARSTQPNWIVSPSIGVDVGVTDNALATERDRRSDFFTLITPSLTVSGETSRVRVNATYSPQATIYARTGSQTRVDQFGNAAALISVVPGSLFLDLRGAITEQSRTGGLGGYSNGNGGTTALNRNDAVQSITVSITPYAEHRFSGWGTGRVGYSFLRTLQDSNNQTNYNRFTGQTQLQQAFNTSGGNQGFGNQGFGNQGFGNQGIGNQGITGNLTTQRERASFITGENLGRFNFITAAEAVQYSGAGAYHNAHRNQLTIDGGYAVSRTVTVIAGTGYQDIRFTGTPGYRLSEPIWSVGVRLTPNPDSSITVGYGRKDGANSLFLDATTAPTARTRLYARYSEGLSTDALGQQDLLQSTTIGSTGLLTDSSTGAPVGSTGAQFGTQNGLYRLRRFSVSGSLLLDRDSFSVSISNEDRSNLSAVTFGPGANGQLLPVLPAGSTSNGTFGSVSWQHELTPVMTFSASASYGVTEYSNLGLGGGNGGSNQQTSLSGQAALNYQFTETLSGSARYLYTERNSNQPQTLFGNQGNLVQNTLLVGLRKSF